MHREEQIVFFPVFVLMERGIGESSKPGVRGNDVERYVHDRKNRIRDIIFSLDTQQVFSYFRLDWLER
jgi:hypothetical protein